MFSCLESIENKELTANPNWASVANRLIDFIITFPDAKHRS